MNKFAFFDVYRSGYALGYQHGQQRRRRKAAWELWLTTPMLWLPFVSLASYIVGYQEGYRMGMSYTHIYQTRGQ